MQWENVYVFISSTFNDMHAERDYLVKKVFPQLSAWCAARKLRLVDIDLRWGVSEADATENKRVVQVCLERIDECRPFFLCFLGQRRGWVPSRKDIGAEAYNIYKKLEEAGYAGSASVTEMEILHALVDPLHGGRLTRADGTARELPAVEHAFFYLRQPGYLNYIIGDHLKSIYTNRVEQDEAAADAELEKWREEIIPRTGRPVAFYEAEWDTSQFTREIAWPYAVPSAAPQGSSLWQSAFEKWERQWWSAGVTVNGDGTITGRELAAARAFNEKLTRGRLGGFSVGEDELAGHIVGQLKQAITARFGAREAPVETPLQKELDQQAQFLHIASEGFIKREGDFDALAGYIGGPERRPMAIAAPAGTGKTSLLAHFIDTCQPQGDETLHYRFVGGSDQSSNVDRLLRSLLTELKEHGKIESGLPAASTELRGKAYDLLEEAGKKGKTILIIDALNQLETGLEDLAWIPAQLPGRVKLIVSFKRGGKSGEAWYGEAKQSDSMLLHDVRAFAEMEDRRKLVEAYLSSYFKELDEAREELLIRSEGADNPLFLKTVLSELRQFGAHQNLTEYIRDSFGTSPVSAFDAVLGRMEADPPYASLPPEVLVPHVFGWLAHTQQGLSVRELAALLVQAGLMADVDEACEAVAVVFRQLRPYLAQRDGRVDFFYESFLIAARQRYSGGHPHAKPAAAWHADLAAYFEAQPYGDTHKLMEQAYQYAHAGNGVALRKLLFDYNYLEARLQAFDIDTLAADFDLAQLPGLKTQEISPSLAALPDDYLDQFVKRPIRLMQECLVLSADTLAVNKEQLAQQLYARMMGDDTMPEVSGLLKQAAAVKKERNEAWLMPLYRNLDAPGGTLRHIWSADRSDVGVVAAVTPDGSRMLMKTGHKKFVLIDTASGKIRKELMQETDGNCYQAVLSADASTAFLNISQTKDGYDARVIDVVDMGTGTCRQSILTGVKSPDTKIFVCENARRILLSAYNGNMQLYENNGGVYTVAFDHRYDRRIVSSLLSRDGKTAFIALGLPVAQQLNSSGEVFRCREIEIWNMDRRLEDGAISFEQNGSQTHNVRDIALSADGRTLAVTELPGISVWDVETRRQTASTPAYRSLVELSADGRVCVCDHANGVSVMDIPGFTVKIPAVLDQHAAAVWFVAVSDDGTKIFSGSMDHTVRMRDISPAGGVGMADNGIDSNTGMANISARPGQKYPARLAYGVKTVQARLSQDRRILAVSESNPRKIRIVDIRTGETLHQLSNISPMSEPARMAVSATGKYLAAIYGQGDLERQLRCWDITTGDCLFTRKLEYKADCVALLEKKRQILLGGEDGDVHIWDIGNQCESGTFVAHPSKVWYMIVPADERMLVTGLHDPWGAAQPERLKIWNTEEFLLCGYAQEAMRAETPLTFCPDGRRFVSAYYDFAAGAPVFLIRDSATGKQQSVLRGCVNHNSSTSYFAAYSENSRWIIIGGNGYEYLLLFDALSGKLAVRLYGSGASYLAAWFVSPTDIAALYKDGKIHYFCIENMEAGHAAAPEANEGKESAVPNEPPQPEPQAVQWLKAEGARRQKSGTGHFAAREYAAAKKDFSAAAEFYAELRDDFHVGGLTEALAHVKNYLGLCHSSMEDYENAASAYMESAALYEMLLPGERTKHLRSLGQVYLNATLAFEKFDGAQALDCCRRSVAAREELKKLSPQDMDAYTTANNYLKKLEQGAR